MRWTHLVSDFLPDNSSHLNEPRKSRRQHMHIPNSEPISNNASCKKTDENRRRKLPAVFPRPCTKTRGEKEEQALTGAERRDEYKNI